MKTEMRDDLSSKLARVSRQETGPMLAAVINTYNAKGLVATDAPVPSPRN